MEIILRQGIGLVLSIVLARLLKPEDFGVIAMLSIFLGLAGVFVDSGFRRGTDIVKALAMGASGVAIGRPYLWGLGAFGEPGVERVLELLRIELMAAMKQVGASRVKDLVPAMVKSA